MTYYIDHEFTTLNDYINAERRNKYVAAKIKKNETELVYYSMLNKPKAPTPCCITITWHTKNKRKDADNIAFAKKFILDGMVKAGIIPNDNLTHIVELHDKFVIDKESYVEVNVTEREKI